MRGGGEAAALAEMKKLCLFVGDLKTILSPCRV